MGNEIEVGGKMRNLNDLLSEGGACTEQDLKVALKDKFEAR